MIALTVASLLAYQVIDSAANDNLAPQISVNSETLSISVNDGEEALLQGIVAKDNVDGDVTNSIIVESVALFDKDGKVKVTYVAFDKAGNVSKYVRDVEYYDYESPKFTLNTSFAFAQNSNTDILSMIKVTDIFDGDIGHRVRATTMYDTSVGAVGNHDVEFRVTNSIGDTVELILPVNVYAQGTYSGKLNLSDYLIYLPVNSSFDKSDYLRSFNVGSDKVDLTGYIPSGISVKASGEVDTSVPGVYSVDYVVTDTRDKSGFTYSAMAKLIVVVEE